MADNENKHVEIDEVQNFSGGEIKSIEPMAEGDTEHGVHGNFHQYSGGQIIERSDTSVSPIFVVSMAAMILIIIATLIIGGFIPGFHPLPGGYGRPKDTTNVGLASVAQDMQASASPIALTSPAFIDMYQLPRPADQSLPQAISAGSDVYQTYCIGCHGPNQDGNGPSAVSLNPSPQNLRNANFMQALSYQRVWTSVHKGVPGTAMPRWENTLTDRQIQDAICYVLSLTAPTDPKSGDFIRPTAQEIAGATNTSAPPSGATSNPTP